MPVSSARPVRDGGDLPLDRDALRTRRRSRRAAALSQGITVLDRTSLTSAMADIGQHEQLYLTIGRSESKE